MISGREESHDILDYRGADRHAGERDIGETLRDLRAGEVDDESHANSEGQCNTSGRTYVHQAQLIALESICPLEHI